MIAVAVLIACVSSCLPVFTMGSCPNRWLPFNGKCYFMSKTKATYHVSLADCNSKGSRLTTVRSIDENNFLAAYVKVRGVPIWVDGNDIRNEGTWISSYNNKKLVFTYWGSGEPGGKRGENCLMINIDLKWHDNPCRMKLYYACEKKMKDPSGKQCLGVRDLLDELIECKKRCK